MVFELIMRYGTECKEVSFEESLTYRTSPTIYCDVRKTDEEIYEEIDNRDIYTTERELYDGELEQEAIVIGDRTVMRLEHRTPDSFVIPK